MSEESSRQDPDFLSDKNAERFCTDAFGSQAQWVGSMSDRLQRNTPGPYKSNGA